jgi:hypothetical protein
MYFLTSFRAKHLAEVKLAKSEAKKNNYLLSHSLAKASQRVQGSSLF